MNEKPKFLVTNDDGIRAPGLKYLWMALKNYADLTVVAPNEEQSGRGVGITLKKDITIKKFEGFETTPSWEVSGTPADCVKMGLGFLCETPDLIISGINDSPNSGRNVLYSGTIGGTIEGALRGIPGIAFSCIDDKIPHYENIQDYIPKIIEYFIMHPMPLGTVINVNFPPKPKSEIKGFKLARQGKSFYIDDHQRIFHPNGEISCRLGSRWEDHEEHANSDVTLLSAGYITAVPIHINELTDHGLLEDHKDRFEEYYSKHFNTFITP